MFNQKKFVMRDVNLLLTIISFNLYAQTPNINMPDFHAMNMDLLKLISR